MNKELNELLKKAVIAYNAMTSEQKEEMHKKQRDGYVKAEMSWPKAKYKWVNGCKVYDSIEDYHND